jgi:UPF0755 protein
MSGYGGGHGTGGYDGYGQDDYLGNDGGRGQQGWQQPSRSSWDDPQAGRGQRGGYGGGGGYDQRTGGQPTQRGAGTGGQPARGTGAQPTRGSGGQPAQRGSGTGPRPAQRNSDPWATDPRGKDPRNTDPRGTGPRRQAGQPGGYGQGGQGGQGGYGGDWDQGSDNSFMPGFGSRGQGQGQGGRYDDGYGDRRDPRGRDPRSGGPRDGRGPAGQDWSRDPRARGGQQRDDRDRQAWSQFHGERKRRGIVRRLAPWVAFLIIIAPIAFGGLYVYHKYEARYHPPDYTGQGTGEVPFQVISGDDAFTVGSRLVTDGIVASGRAFTNAAQAAPASAPGLEAGYYMLHHHMQASIAYQDLTNPKFRVQVSVTIPEGKRVSQILTILAAHMKLPLSDFQQVIAHPAQLGLPSYANGKAEGFLFPATYTVQPHETALQILQQMVQRYNVEAQHINIAVAAKAAGLTPYTLLIEASLVQAEAGRVKDFADVAEVTNNRLKAGMALHYDSTVLYGVGKYGTRATAYVNKPGPYNTYLNKGLPPTPIGNPGDAAIQAVLHPATGNYYFFVGCKHGITKFANQLSELPASC